MDKSISTVN